MNHEYPKYQCHKTVEAVKIARVLEETDIGWTLEVDDGDSAARNSSIFVEKAVLMGDRPRRNAYLVFEPSSDYNAAGVFNYVTVIPGAEFQRKYMKKQAGGTTQCRDLVDADGMPAGGSVRGPGIVIDWQSGPLQDDEHNDLPRNGAFVLEVLAAVAGRLEHYQSVADGRFRCRENSLALTKLEEAMMWLRARLERRKAEGSLGTHKS